ncbi:glycosyltransferase [bacterium]|nr:glycosyltransferase [bacterium]
MITIENKRILIVGFNIGYAGRYVNGPGISFYNFCRILSKKNVDYICSSCLEPRTFRKNINFVDFQALSFLKNKKFDAIHIWSEISDYNLSILKKMSSKTLIIGPNLLDCVNIDKEKDILKKYMSLSAKNIISYSINKDISRKILDIHDITSETLSVGPDFDIWKDDVVKKDFILWKGNSTQYVKNVKQALDIKKRLPELKFIIMGHPHPYSYGNHIEIAKKAKLYFSTSLSETKSNTVAEQMACGTPCITNENIFFKGLDQKTGIITDGKTESYCNAIKKILSDKSLYLHMKKNSSEYCRDYFNNNEIVYNYLRKL